MSITPYLMGELAFLSPELLLIPENIKAMSLAFDEACKTLCATELDAKVRDAIASRIIGLARGGELRPDVLRDQVVFERFAAAAAVVEVELMGSRLIF